MGLKTVFMGTPETAVPILIALHELSDIKLVVTQPDRPRGRKRVLQPTAVKTKALELGLEVIQPEKIKKNKDFEAMLKDIDPDVAVVVAYGKILPESVLNIPAAGCVNIHFSLLPLYRGAAPVNWALVNGETETGVTMMKMDKGLDTGPVISVKKREVLPEDNTLVLLEKLASDGALLLSECLEQYVSAHIQPVEQDHSCATYAPLMKKDDGRIDFHQSAETVFNRVRGFYPWPSAFSTVNGTRFKVVEAQLTEWVDSEQNVPGMIVKKQKQLCVVCGDRRLLSLKKIQPESKKVMDALSCLNGGYLTAGDCFDQ